MLTQEQAITIARKAIEGKVDPQKDCPIETTVSDDQYIVTFIHINPPGVRGPDYDARVTIDRKTGKVVELLGGP